MILMTDFICPQPREWDRQYKILKRACLKQSIDPSSIPIPLLLSGWWYSDDSDKRERWYATLRWAESQGFSDLLTSLDENTGFKGDAV